MIVRGAKAVIFDNDGNILTVRRSASHPHVPLSVDLPGGKIEEEETIAQGLLREIKEETAIVVSESDLSLVSSADIAGFYGKDFHVELYEIKLGTRPDITLSFEHDKYEWVPLEQAKIVGKLFEALIEQYRKSRL